MIANSCFTGTCDCKPDPTGTLAWAGPAGAFLELRRGLCPHEVDRRIAQAMRANDVGARVLAFYLLDLAERGAHQALGFHSILLYAHARYGLLPRTTREYVSIGRALEELPEVERAFGEGRLLWSQVRLLTRIATAETESEWVEWSAGRSVRDVEAQVRIRRKGERPADPARRRIHATKIAAGARLDAVQWEVWSSARAKLEAELGRPVEDAEFMVHAAKVILTTRSDGTVPGRTPVNDSHFKVVIRHSPADGSTEVMTADGPEPLDPATAAATLAAAGREDLARAVRRAIAENRGPDVPPELRDKPISPEMRAAVLARDGNRCCCCGGRKNLTVHHKRWRRRGGRTRLRNLMTLCEHCHSLVHDGFIIIAGRIPGRLYFVDAEGNEIARMPDPAGAALREVTMKAPEARPASPDAAGDAAGGADADGEGGARAPRPKSLDEIVGQMGVVANLRRAVRAAKALKEPVPHVLLCGPPGLGKATLGRAVAAQMGAGFHSLSASSLRTANQLIRVLTSLRHGDILFLDEVHRLPPRVADLLGEAMQKGALSLPSDLDGGGQNVAHVRLRPFTLIGATTRVYRLSERFRTCFANCYRLTPYGHDELQEIVTRAAADMSLSIGAEAAKRLAEASLQMPGEALALLQAAREEAVVRGRRSICPETVRAVLDGNLSRISA